MHMNLILGHVLLQESYTVFLRKTLNKLPLVYKNWEFMQALTMPIWNPKIRPRFILGGQPMNFRLSICVFYESLIYL